jgi:hypothetical protein
LLKKKYILIKSQYETNYSIYYDLENKCFLKRKESTPKSIYFFSVLFIVFVRGFNETDIYYPFWLVLFVAVFIGVILGFFFYKFDQFVKSKSFEQVDNSYEKQKEYVSLGKILLSNQKKVVVATFILFFIIAITLYFNTTTKNFFGILMLSFVLSYFINFCAPIEKKYIFSNY